MVCRFTSWVRPESNSSPISSTAALTWTCVMGHDSAGGEVPMSEIDYVGPLTERQSGNLPDHLGFEWLEARPGFVRGRFIVSRAPHGAQRLHACRQRGDAGGLSAAAMAASFRCRRAATGFTTIELKTNFLGTGEIGRRDRRRSAPGPRRAHDASVGRRGQERDRRAKPSPSSAARRWCFIRSECRLH